MRWGCVPAALAMMIGLGSVAGALHGLWQQRRAGHAELERLKEGGYRE